MIKHEHCISGNMNVKKWRGYSEKRIYQENKKLCGRKERERGGSGNMREKKGGQLQLQLQFTFKS